MKKTIFFLIMCILGLSQSMAQLMGPDDWWEWDYSDYMPIVQEGVKWVNERVIINQGDTTRYYYTYEIQGDDTTSYQNSYGNTKLCHYYTGESIDYSNDSIISSLEESTIVGKEITCFDNWAFDKVVREGKNIMPHNFWTGEIGGELLYRFYHGYPEFLILCHYYTNHQVEPILTEENFTMIEPIEIDGCICNRYAYVKENGDTMCYVVEGIGFDSRNMGDLLTPFTREPDSDADYQEYWGLSHVVKDGKIIYKGMRFNPALFENPGDVNGDGEVNIADANSVIDIVILGGNAGHTRAPAADANHDGEVNIGDINYIINFILNGE